MSPLAASALSDIVARNRAGEAVGIVSVCSAHPLVIEAAVREALGGSGPLLIEATSNQVDQFGGYTGMTPADFRAFVEGIVLDAGLDPARLILGGDHLGPNRWQGEAPESAMEKAEAQIAAYVAAGFSKIHLDCSMSCAGDPVPLGDAEVARRAARLARVAEAAAEGRRIDYVVGTEVPVPGGAREALDHGVVPTDPRAALATVEAHRQAFEREGVGAAFERVVGLVVQPGVEFDHTRVVDYDRPAARSLVGALDAVPGITFEAHSTDYQTRGALTALVADHFAILKVGPGLTFALREALFALDAMEAELVPEAERAALAATVERRMREEPGHWRNYYEGTEAEQAFARRYSLSDRIRYYWPDREVRGAEERLFANLTGRELPLPLLSQHMPEQFRRVREGRLDAAPKALVLDRIADVLRDYAAACGQTAEGE